MATTATRTPTPTRSIVRRGTSQAEKRLNELRASSQRARAKAKSERDEMRQLGTVVLTSALLGWAENRGHLARIPTVGGMPRLVSVAAIGLVASEYVGGTAGDVLRGVGASAAAIGAYQLANRGSISGDQGASLNDAVNRLASRMADTADVAGETEFIIED